MTTKKFEDLIKEHIQLDPKFSEAFALAMLEERNRIPYKVALFLKDLIDNLFEGGLDNFELQELMVKHGILVETLKPEPCCEECTCKCCDADFPTTCYRLASDILDALKTDNK